MNDAVGIAETPGLTVALATADAMGKAASVRVLQAELNDLGGVCLKVGGKIADVRAALDACQAVTERMGVRSVVALLARPTDTAVARGILSRAEFSPLIEQAVVFEPAASAFGQTEKQEDNIVEKNPPPAIGLIETQGYTAVLQAIDTACKAANVQVLGKEKLGGGYITVLVAGDIAAVEAAVVLTATTGTSSDLEDGFRHPPNPQRKAFVASHHLHADSKLVPSGLFGPVRILMQ